MEFGSDLLPTNQSDKNHLGKFVVSLIVLAVMQVNLLAGRSSANEPFDTVDFIKDVEIFNAFITTRYPIKSLRDKQWQTNSSPWHPYLQRQFVEGLSVFARNRHNGYVERGNCEKAARLEISGMFALYPHMQDIFYNSEISLLFSSAIYSRFSFADKRCRAIRIINPLIREAKFMSVARGMHFNAYEAQLHISNAVHRPARPVNLNEMTLTTAGHTLQRLALCHHYQPAIVDLVKFESELPFINIADIRGYYFIVLAKTMGLAGDVWDAHTFRFLTELEHREQSRIKNSFKNYSVENASNILPYRKAACRLSVPQLP